MGKDLPLSGLGYFRGRKRMAARRSPAVLGLGRRCHAAGLGLLLASVSSALSLEGAFVSSPARGVASVRRQPPPAVSIRREIRGESLLLRRSELKSGGVARLDCQAGEDLTMLFGKILPIVPSEAGYLPEFDVGPSSVPSGLRLAGAFQNVSRHMQEIPSVLCSSNNVHTSKAALPMPCKAYERRPRPYFLGMCAKYDCCIYARSAVHTKRCPAAGLVHCCRRSLVPSRPFLSRLPQPSGWAGGRGGGTHRDPVCKAQEWHAGKSLGYFPT